ncbi:ran GTPase-activating protein 1-like isoform X2 [Watersipora subatra]|uniref:ran GTPase-activating protein 1-like isoform X2 n=1 Tax=Watersipora subatra TaxID=2589382 RepID=UPI00355B7B7A
MADVDQLSNLFKGANVEDGILSFAGKAIKMNNAADASEIVKAVEEQKVLKVLILEGNTMGVEAADLIGKALATHKEFQRAKWSDMFTGRLKTEIPPALKFLGNGIMNSGANLVELDLSDNAFGPIGVEGIADLLRSNSCYSLQELRLNNNGLGPSGGKMLAAVLDETYESSCKAGKRFALKVFVSGRGRLENEGSIALSHVFKKMKSLEYVSMPQNGINPPGIKALAEAFSFNTNLKHINLCDNTCTVTGAQAIAEAIPKLTNLETLNLESCLIRTGGAKSIAKALDGKYPHLKEILCNYNEINKSGAVSLVEVAALIPSLRCIQLDGNSLGEEGKELIYSTLESAGKSDIISSLSDDEGTEDENEDGHEEIEDVATDRLDEAQVVPVEKFIESPSASHLVGLTSDDWLRHVQQELSHLNDETDISDRVVFLCMKLASPLTTSCKSEITNKAFSLCDKTFEVISTRQASSTLCNSLLVNLGLIKSENKKFKLASEDLTGPLIMVEHIVQQGYFPSQSVKTLHFYLSRQSEQKLSNYFHVNNHLLQTLFAM